ncbi:RNA polymerase sigma factor [Mucilaginibacter sp. UR6-11]|uniref:RNA polymerase sigma factor n=1 Tax=Mucilaginibacter sp. UR6-11 TaxID=1435644 RepID=UPI001E38B7A1|nr:RNA polymerase sigma-70 factor [Mucilaginibacter sp. UR6-11]MCC8424298.1 RNA polymerase sigma-70 factor [Mucilaginibacter sp. UR6-11]
MVYNNFTDQELAVLLKEGNHDAFLEIYVRYYSLLYIFAYKKLNCREETKDVIQEVFIALWTCHEHFSLTTSLSAYLYSAVRNRSMNVFSRKKMEDKYLQSLQGFLSQYEAGADYQIREKDIALTIEKGIADLPCKMREIFELSRKEHLTYKEIAQSLDISEHTVSTQVKRALKVLRVKLGMLILACFV